MSMIKKIGLTILVVVLLLILIPLVRLATFTSIEFSMASIEVPVTGTAAAVAQNKTVAQLFYQQLYSPETETAIADYLADAYSEHQMQAGYSKAGLAAYVAQRRQEHPNLEIIIHRAIGQGDLVFLHVEEKVSATQSVARAELFRIGDGKITEHWAAGQAVPDTAANTNGMFSGPAINPDSMAGQDHLARVLSSYFDAFVNADIAIARATTTQRYIQHTPDVADGVDAFIGLLNIIRVMKGFGLDTQIDIRIAMTEGDYVVMLTHFHLPLARPHSNVFDMYRLTEDGLKDEHWDVIEVIGNEAEIEKVF